jgi:ribonuclease BN (tRNA processing enzyme)
MPGPESPASSYLVEADGSQLVLDLGNGALSALQRHADLRSVDGICLSHLHADHCIDLCGYFVRLEYGPGHSPRLPVWGPDGTAERLAVAYGVPIDPGMTSVFDFRHYPDGAFRVGSFTVTTARVNHLVPTYAIRVEHGGKSLVYSGDTGESPSLIELAREADLLLCEAGFGTSEDEPPGIHLNGRLAGEHARAAGVRRLMVTHVLPWYDKTATMEAAQTAFGGEVVAAAADQTWEIT